MKIIYPIKQYKFQYNTLLYPFDQAVTDALNVKYLSRLNSDYAEFTLETEQKSNYHKMWYKYVDDNYNNFVNSLYRNFILNYIINLFDEPIIFQTKPTFRCHLIGNKAVANWHKDMQYNHHMAEVNFFLPITRAFENNTIWIESEENKGDFAPIEANFGECVVFPGATHMHGNKLNDTTQTRVSLDFRVLPKRYYSPNDRISKVQGKRFIIGDYWSEING